MHGDALQAAYCVAARYQTLLPASGVMCLSSDAAGTVRTSSLITAVLILNIGRSCQDLLYSQWLLLDKQQAIPVKQMADQLASHRTRASEGFLDAKISICTALPALACFWYPDVVHLYGPR